MKHLYVDFDHHTEMFCIFDTEEGRCYGTYASSKEAQTVCDKLNGEQIK